MGSIELIREVAPNWVAIESQTLERLSFSAIIRRAGDVSSRDYKLEARAPSQSSLSLREQSQSKMLPTYCPERHINDDGSFCLGFEAGKNIETIADATMWWKKVEAFLECQETAHNTGCWPKEIQISHGKAGAIQIQAEGLAEELRMGRDLGEAIHLGRGPIARASASLLRKGKIPNSRSACVCGRKKTNGTPLLRRDCKILSDECLVHIEAKRISASNSYDKSIEKKHCCGSIASCSLNKQRKAP